MAYSILDDVVGFQSITEYSDVPLVELGLIVRAYDKTQLASCEFVYAKTGISEIQAGAVCLIGNDFVLSLINQSETGAVCVSVSNVPSNSYAWFQIYGHCTVNTDGSFVAANSELFAVVTDGAVSSSETSNKVVSGMYSVSISEMASVDAMLQRPFLLDVSGGAATASAPSCIATVDANVSIAAAQTAQKLNISNIFTPDGNYPCSINPSGNLVVLSGKEGKYRIDLYARVVGFDAGGGFVAPVFSMWGGGDASVTNQSTQSLAETAIATASVYSVYTSYEISLSEGSEIAFYVSSSNLNSRLDYDAFPINPLRPTIYPFKAALTKL